MEASQVTAVVLAGGIGKRFVPFLHDKTLFPFMGQSLLERTLQMIQKAGIQKVVVATNRYNTAWLAQNAPRFSLDISWHEQNNPAGMADALLTLAPHLPEQNIIVMNAGDMVADHLLPELLEQASDHSVVLTGLETPEYQPLGYFSLDGSKITGIVEKPGAQNMPSNLANLVFHFFREPKRFLALLESAQAQSTPQADDIYEQALNVLIGQGEVGSYRYVGPWQKLKFGYHVLDMMEFFLRDMPSFRHESAQIASSAQIHGNVYISENAKILDGAVLSGPCFIGPGVVIGNQALVRQSMVEAGATIGYGSEVVRSYVGAQSDLHHAYVGDSVLESSVHFGYGAHTANFRLDKKAVAVKQLTGPLETSRQKLGALIAQKTEVGVNVSLLPGVTIGANAVIYPGAIVHQPIPDNHVLKFYQEQALTERDSTA